MDKREERSRSKKAIIGVVLATVVLASATVAMLGSIGASSTGGPYNNIEKDTVNTVLIGQDLLFNPDVTWTTPIVINRYVSGDLENTYPATESGGKYYIYNVNWPTTGAYYVKGYKDQGEGLLYVEGPKLPLTLKVKDREVSSIVWSTSLNIDIGGINLFDEDKVDLVIIGPKGQITEKNGQMFTNIPISALKSFTGSGAIDTTGWDIGHYTFQVKTKPDYACGLDVRSATKALSIIETITIEADTTEVPELTVVRLTVTGVPGHQITVKSDPLSRNVYFPAGLDDNPMGVTTQWFNDTIDDDGTRTYAVMFNATGFYTIRVTDWAEFDSYDTVDISVTDKEVIFDMPSTVVIGDRFHVKGTANTGQTVTIAVEDEVVQKLYQIVIDENGEFNEAIDTSSHDAPSAFMVPGLVRVKAYIDYDQGTGTVPDYTKEGKPLKDDGSTEVFMVRGWLTGSLSDDTVEPCDDFTITGTANGSKSVSILIVAPKGFSGSNIEGGKMMYYATTSVTSNDNTFYKKIYAGNNVDAGRYLVAVLSPGSDGLWGKYGYCTLYNTDYPEDTNTALGQYTLFTRTQEEMLEVVNDMTYLSDDLIWVDYVTVGEQETLTLDLIEDVVTGDTLVVTGDSSMKEGSAIWLTVKGRYFEIVPQAAYVSDNTFNATFDTTGAPPGIYTVQALDGSGRISTTKVLIYTEGVVPTSFDTGAGSYPSIMGTHNGTITIQRRQWW
ncbi:hypothetical protein C5S35_00460 [Candidatus Methanophagaceae archaeon]|nr:hypothetical protein C5S35_00460 [Methanophagales archaeon]